MSLCISILLISKSGFLGKECPARKWRQGWLELEVHGKCWEPETGK
jgi:hypothetical protein